VKRAFGPSRRRWGHANAVGKPEDNFPHDTFHFYLGDQTDGWAGASAIWKKCAALSSLRTTCVRWRPLNREKFEWTIRHRDHANIALIGAFFQK
jgi:hypothetical protein